MTHIQPTHGPRTDNTMPTTGGNRTLINGDEFLGDDQELEAMQCVYSELGEDDSHVTPVYREHSYGREM